jgi:DsbC/DsbD-like thiol-disulfide interchange protein
MTVAVVPSSPLIRLTGAILLAAIVLVAVGGGSAPAAQDKDDPLIKVTAKSDKVDKDGWQVISIKMDVDKDWHAYANPVQHPGYEANKTLVKVTSAKKLDDVKVDFPKGVRQVDGADTFYVYKGSVEIEAKVKRAAGDGGALEVTVKYVLCSDKEGVCLPQKSVVLTVK